jgi:hypothetical protein
VRRLLRISRISDSLATRRDSVYLLIFTFPDGILSSLRAKAIIKLVEEIKKVYKTIIALKAAQHNGRSA